MQAQLTYTTNNGSITITGYTGSGGILIIPGTTNGLPVTDLGDYAFLASTITNVTIPSNVTNIGNFTFADCLELTNVTIPGSVKTIGADAFYNCANLGSITIPDGVAYVGKGAFYDCTGLSSVSLGNEITNIDLFAFYACTSLKNVIIPNSLTNVGSDIFEGCSALTNAVISYGVSSIGDDVFSGCSSLTGITFPSTLMFIGDGTFTSCTSLTNLVVPDSVVYLGNDTFDDCTNLTNFVLGTGVTNIGSEDLANCFNLTAISVKAANPAYSSSGGVLFNKDQTTLIEYPDGLAGAYTIPNSVTSVADDAFAGCVNLSSVTISNNVTSLGDSAFFSCVGLATITIGSGVSTIGVDTFYECGSLTNVVIGNGVTSIGDAAFTFCTNLTSVIIPDNVTSLGNGSFNGCSRLTNVVIGAGVSSFGTSVFDYCNDLTTINVSVSNLVYTSVGGILFSHDQTSLIEYPAGLTNSYVVPDGVASLGVGAFDNCYGLTQITIPSSVTDIEDDAFLGCSNLSGLYFQGNAPNLDGTSVFYDIDSQAVVYYEAGTANWGTTYGGLPAVMLNPQPPISSVGVQSNQFGFTFTGTNSQAIIIETSTNLANPNWQPLQTNTLNGTTFNFADPQWRNYSRRFYRVVSAP